MTFKSHRDYLDFLKTRKVFIEEKTSWSNDYLKERLGKSFEIIKPYMPSRENSKYSEWKIHFERFFPFFRNNLILIGNSLGGIFLAKYLSENKFPKKIAAVYLIAPPFENTLSGEKLAGGFKLKKNLSVLEKNTPNLTLCFSQDDNVVPISHAKKYREKLNKAKIKTYSNKHGHFRVAKFPEIVAMIKKDIQGN
jgi:hypothetical protein